MAVKLGYLPQNMVKSITHNPCSSRASSSGSWSRSLLLVLLSDTSFNSRSLGNALDPLQ